MATFEDASWGGGVDEYGDEFVHHHTKSHQCSFEKNEKTELKREVQTLLTFTCPSIWLITVRFV